MNAKSQQNNQLAFKLKGSVLTVSVLQLLSLNEAFLQQQLEETVKRNPDFFNHMPVIIDLQKLYSLDTDIQFNEIHALLRRYNLSPVGVMNANPKQTQAAIDAGLAILPNLNAKQIPKASKKVEQSKIITQPVRSGQQIYAQGSDLIILSPVSNGAEVLADGSIHVYAPLRGRAIAGANGDKSARIFCHKLEAELISIAGYYKLQEDLAKFSALEHCQIYLEDDQMMITPFN